MWVLGNILNSIFQNLRAITHIKNCIKKLIGENLSQPHRKLVSFPNNFSWKNVISVERRSRLPIADSQCAQAVWNPRFQTDADSRSVIPKLIVLSVLVSYNKR